MMLVVFTYMVPEIVFGQPDTLWTRTYGGSGRDHGSFVKQVTDGGFIVVGSTNPYGVGADVWIIRTDSGGDTLWTRTYGDDGSNWDGATSVQQTSDGGFIVAGYTDSYGSGNSDFWLIRTDASGDTLWTRTYGGSGSDVAFSVQETTGGGYIIAGHTTSYGAGDHDIWLVRTDFLGDTLWTRTYGGISSDVGSSVEQTRDGGFIVAGGTGSFGAGSWDIWLIRTDSLGNAVWKRTYGGTEGDLGESLQQCADGGFIVTGYTRSYGAGGFDVWLIRTNAVGDTLWTRTYGGSEWDVGFSVRQTSDGGYIVTGGTTSYGAGLEDVWLVRTDSTGGTLWTSTFGTDGNDRGLSTEQTTDDGFIVAGFTDPSIEGWDDLWLIRLTPEKVDLGGDPFVLPQVLALHQNYPNPFNPTTTISYQLPQSALVNISIYNVAGRLVETLVSEQKNVGYYSVIWNASGIGSGLYFYRIVAGEYTETKKCLILK